MRTHKYLPLILLLLIVLRSLVGSTAAHPGNTDANGGHIDRSTGEYHYHHGYGAHQHPGGQCPYDFDNKTGQNSGSSSGYSTSTYDENSRVTSSDTGETDQPETDQSETETNQIKGGEAVPPWVYWVIGILIFVILCMYLKIRSKNSQIAKQNQLKKSEVETLTREHTSQLNSKDSEISLLKIEIERQREEQRKLINSLSYLISITEKDMTEEDKSDFDEKYAQCIAPDLGIPPDVYFIDGLVPVSGEISYNKPYGDFTVYISQSGKRYHSNGYCGGAYLYAAHAYDVIDKKTPCLNCGKPFPHTVPDWYLKIKDLANNPKFASSLTEI